MEVEVAKGSVTNICELSFETGGATLQPSCQIVASREHLTNGVEIQLTVQVLGEVTDLFFGAEPAELTNPIFPVSEPGVYLASVVGPNGQDTCAKTVNLLDTQGLSCQASATPATVVSGQAATIAVQTSDDITGLQIGTDNLDPAARNHDLVLESSSVIAVGVQRGDVASYCHTEVTVTQPAEAVVEVAPTPTPTMTSTPTPVVGLPVPTATPTPTPIPTATPTPMPGGDVTECNNTFLATLDRETCYSETATSLYNGDNLASCRLYLSSSPDRFACARMMAGADLSSELRTCSQALSASDDRLSCLADLKGGDYSEANVDACRTGFTASTSRFSCAEVMGGVDLADELSSCAQTFSASTSRLTCLTDLRDQKYSAGNLVSCRQYLSSSASRFQCAGIMAGEDLSAKLAACAAMEASASGRLSCLAAP